MKNRSGFFILFLSVFYISCVEEGPAKGLSALTNRWFSARSLSILAPKYFGEDKESLKRPIHTVQLLFSVLKENEKKDCFYYRISKEIFIVETSFSSECPAFPRPPYSWHLKKRILKDLTWKKEESFLLLTIRDEQKEEKTIRVEFFNFLKRKKNYKKYDSSGEIRKYKGLSIWKKSSHVLRLREEGPYPTDNSRFRPPLKKCHVLNHNCEETLKNNCHDCPFGFFEAVGKSCEGRQRTKFCGPNLCGRRGWPACWRGSDYGKRVNSKGCRNNMTGFCHKGLKAVCDDEGILVCL